MSAPFSGSHMRVFESHSNIVSYRLVVEGAPYGETAPLDAVHDLTELSQALDIQPNVQEDHDRIQKECILDKSEGIQDVRWKIGMLISGMPTRKIYLHRSLQMKLIDLGERGQSSINQQSVRERDSHLERMTDQEHINSYHMLLFWLRDKVADICLAKGIIEEGQRNRIIIDGLEENGDH